MKCLVVSLFVMFAAIDQCQYPFIHSLAVAKWYFNYKISSSFVNWNTSIKRKLSFVYSFGYHLYRRGRFKCLIRASLVVQWLRIHLPMQGTWVWALVQEDLTCCGATKPVCHNYWTRMPQLLKPACLEPVLCNKRSHCNEKPTHHDEEKGRRN